MSVLTARNVPKKDPKELKPAHNLADAIPPELLRRVRALVRSMDVSDEAIDRWFAAFATRLKPGHEIEAPRRAIAPRTIAQRLGRGDVVARSEDGRWAFLPRHRLLRGAARRRREDLLLFVGGVEITVPADAADLARALCSSPRAPPAISSSGGSCSIISS